MGTPDPGGCPTCGVHTVDPTGAEARSVPARSSPPPNPRLKPVGGNSTKVIVRIDHTALLRGHAIAGETVEISGLGPITVTSAKELMSDAFLAAVVTKGVDVTTVAHLGRSPTAFQRTAIEALDSARCTNIACNTTVGLELDHRDPWASTHQTPTNGLDPLCRDCHQQKTRHGWTLTPGTGRRLFHPPGGGGRTAAASGGGADRPAQAQDPDRVPDGEPAPPSLF